LEGGHPRTIPPNFGSNITAILITYIKGGTLAQIFLEKGSAMVRATLIFF
jgi:hypothetical protein